MTDDFDDEFGVDASPHPPRCGHPSLNGLPGTNPPILQCASCNADFDESGNRLLDPEVVSRFDSFWAEIVTRWDGTLDLDQVKCELHDYWTCIDQVPRVYGEITANTLSKPNYLASEVIAVHNQRCPNVTALIEELREVLEGRGDHDDLPDRDTSATIEDAARLMAERLDRVEEALQSHETLHSAEYRRERERQ